MKGLKYLVTGLISLLVLAVPAFAETAPAAETAGTSACAMTCGTPLIWWLAPISALVALLFAYIFHKQMMTSPAGTDRMQEIAGYVREGAYAYLFSQYKVVFVVFIVLAAIFTVLAHYGIQNGFVPVAFFTAGICSALTGLIGMNTATLASNRTAWGASAIASIWQP